jgi:hypothetical protein
VVIGFDIVTNKHINTLNIQNYGVVYNFSNMEADNLSKKALKKLPGRISFSQWEDGIEPPPSFFEVIISMCAEFSLLSFWMIM